MQQAVLCVKVKADQVFLLQRGEMPRLLEGCSWAVYRLAFVLGVCAVGPTAKFEDGTQASGAGCSYAALLSPTLG